MRKLHGKSRKLFPYDPNSNIGHEEVARKSRKVFPYDPNSNIGHEEVAR